MLAATAAAYAACAVLLAPNASSLALGRAFVATALAAARNHLSHDLVVCLAPGVHSVALSPHALTAEHSVVTGPGRVVWRGASPASTLVSGGAQVTGWTPTTLGGAPVYAARVPAAAGAAVIRQLWVGGARAARTVVQSPADALGGLALWTAPGGAVGYVAGAVPTPWLANARSIEFTWPIVIHNWVAPRCTIASIAPLAPPPGGITGPLAGVSVVSAGGLLPHGNVSHQIRYAGDFDSAAACAAACVAAADCTAYTWHDASVAGYALECFFRIDGAWEPSAGWAGHFSGDKTSGGANITLASPCGAFLVAAGVAAPVTAEAAPVFPLAPGTFFHDAAAATLYYALAAGQSAADLEADAWVAVQEVLVSADGVRGHAWEGIGFVYGAWAQANSGDGFVDEQAAVYACSAGAPFCDASIAARPGAAARGSGSGGLAEPRGNVRVSGGAAVSFSGCAFSHLGAAYALSIMGGSQAPLVTNCTFTDLSGGALKLGSVATAAAGSADPADWDAGAIVTHNVADDMAIEYAGSVGVFNGFLFSAVVASNSVSDAGYSGFSQGWGWGTVFPPGVGNNTISYNKISNVMRLLRDGGGIYLNGAENASWPSAMHHNFVTGDNAVYAVYYLDNGASFWHVHDNVCTRSPSAWAFYMTGYANLPAKNNRMESLWYSAADVLPPHNDCAQFNCTVDNATIVAVTGSWPPAAQAIIDGSGAGV